MNNFNFEDFVSKEGIFIFSLEKESVFKKIQSYLIKNVVIFSNILPPKFCIEILHNITYFPKFLKLDQRAMLRIALFKKQIKKEN